MDIITGATVKSLSKGEAVYEKDGTEHKLTGFETIVLALGTESYNPLYESLKKLDLDVYVIGDAQKAGKAIEATNTAAEVALKA